MMHPVGVYQTLTEFLDLIYSLPILQSLSLSIPFRVPKCTPFGGAGTRTYPPGQPTFRFSDLHVTRGHNVALVQWVMNLRPMPHIRKLTLKSCHHAREDNLFTEKVFGVCGSSIDHLELQAHSGELAPL